MFLILGDRLKAGDPAGLLIGGGAMGLLGAVAGGIAGAFGGDGPQLPDRIRPPTGELQYMGAELPALDESNPASLSFRFAPNFFFPADGGRLRIFGSIGGPLGDLEQVDPRPQNNTPIDGQDGTFPVVLRERRWGMTVGADLAVNLPYPVLAPRRSAHLGAAELRYKPMAVIARHTFDPGSDQERVVERTMLLPLTVGMRWRLSPRQRFTVYLGPRFDIVSHSEPGSRSLARGAPNVGSFYGEAWYDIDVRLQRPGLPHRVEIVGQVTFGYVHTRFGGQGFSPGTAVGFLGPAQVAWHMRFRRPDARWAMQAALGAWVGDSITGFLRLGAVLPDVGEARGRS